MILDSSGGFGYRPSHHSQRQVGDEAVSNSTAPGEPEGNQYLIQRKLDDLGAMHMRTREDVAEIKATTREIASNQVKVERRVDDMEKQVDERFKSHAQEIDGRIGRVEKDVTTIREERIAEKAQWRGPEKLIAVLGTIGAILGALAAVKGMGWF